MNNPLGMSALTLLILSTFNLQPATAFAQTPRVMQVAGGGFHTLFIKSDGSLWAMGFNLDGALGDGAANDSFTNTPQMIVSDSVTAVAGGAYHSLFAKSDGSLWAMGDNPFGDLGDGPVGSTNRPVQSLPPGTPKVTAMAGGFYHSLVLKSDGSLWAMGYNFDGQLGAGSAVSSARTPLEIVPNNVTAIAAGAFHSLFLKSDGSLWGMGACRVGELGVGTTNDVFDPVEIETNGVIAIASSSGAEHSLFLKSDHTLWGMGFNGTGQLGNGTTNNALNPVWVSSNVMAMACGGGHSVLLKSDGSLWAVGDNSNGQLGDGTTNNSLVPLEIVTNGVTAIAAGWNHNLFIKADGTLWGMGENDQGELGDGGYADSHEPEQIVPLLKNIVQNGGFETGDFSGWTFLSSFGFDNTIVANPHSGTYAAQFHKNTSGLASVVMSQTLPTQPNQAYLLSLWVNGISNGGGLVDWNGTELVNQSFNSGWTQFEFVVKATSTSTVLKFVTVYDTTALDDVSVVPLPNYDWLTGQLLNTGAMQFSFQGNANAMYALDRTFNLSPPVTWTPQLTNFTDPGGLLLLTNTPVPTTNNFWRVRSVP